MLIIFGGLPATGKTTLAKEISKHLKATYIRIDSIEQAIKNSMLKVDEVIDAGYLVGYAVAKDNLITGRTVVADSVNPIELTRKAWRDIAKESHSNFIEIEVICSDKIEHQQRVETRKPDISSHQLPNWHHVVTRDYAPWKDKHIMIDTAGKSIEECVKEILPCLPQIPA